MVRIITFIVFFVVSIATAQTPFEHQMTTALKTLKEGKTSEALVQFERIASVEKANWLPNYYIALSNTIQAFDEKDKVKTIELLQNAQKAQDICNRLAGDNPEVLVMQAMIHTAWIVYDPMIYGRTLSEDVMSLLNRAYEIAPENPRVVFQKASFEMGMANYFGQDTQPMCGQIEKSIKLFATFKPETPSHPNWGLEKAQEASKNCK